MTGELAHFLREERHITWPDRREGKWVRFQKMHERVMGRAVYNVLAVRGEGFSMGRIEFRNQWNDWSMKFDPGVPLNMEIIAEIYAMLRELRSK